MNSDVADRRSGPARGLVYLAAAWCTGLSIPANAENLMNTTQPLIPRQILFGNPERAAAQVSPDGKRVSFLAPDAGVLNVWVGPADDPARAKPVTSDRDRGIRRYFWAWDNEHVLYLQDVGGDENWHVYAVNVETRESRDLTPLKSIQARVEQVSQRFPNEILIAMNDRDPNLHDLYRVDIRTGARTRLIENPGFLDFLADSDYRVRFASRMRPDGGMDLMRHTAEEAFEPFLSIPHEDALTTHPIGLDEAGTTLYMIDSRDRNTAACIAIDLANGSRKVLAEDERADAGSTMRHPRTRAVEAVRFDYQRAVWKTVDPSIEADLERLKTLCNGDFSVEDRSLDDRYWIVEYVVDDGPVRYYYYDRQKKDGSFLFTNRPALEGRQLATMHPRVLNARDGQKLVSYLSLPPGSDADRTGRPDKPLPMVLLVHGGPWARDDWGYDSLHQWLTNRGYAVLSVNFRGSTGFGKAFINAADRQWGRSMHDDLLDGVAWAIEQKIADPKRVAIMGGSYGGYATLWGVTNTPEIFCCGVDIVGPSNLATLIDSIPPYWKPMLDMFAQRVGDPRTEEGRKLLHERSPLTYVNQIRCPLLIGQGANDPRVKQAESDQIVREMREKQIPVTYVLFPDEGHGFARPENSLAFWAVTEGFLAAHLGGRAEPIGDDFDGSSIEVHAGADDIPGINNALKGKHAKAR